ncbi:unnamed protein product [Leuciscus chuanchicus]
MPSCLMLLPNSRGLLDMFWNYCLDPSDSWAARGCRSGVTPHVKDGILYELMLERTYDLPKEREWVMRRDNWMSNTIQSEIIQQFAHAIPRDIVARSSESRFYGLTADGTTDVSTTEQFSCNLQFVDGSLESHWVLFRSAGSPQRIVPSVNGVATVIGESPKRKQLFESLLGCDEVTVNILGLCPTRWCVCATAIKRVCFSYGTLLATLNLLKDDKKILRGDSRSKIGGLWNQARKGRTFFGLLCCQALFEPCEAVARGLQSSKASALGALECANVLKDRIAALRDDDIVEEMVHKVEVCASEMDLKMRHQFYQAVDLVSAELKRRFDQESMTLAASRERVVIVAAGGGTVDLEPLQLPKELDTDRLNLQLKMLCDVTRESQFSTVRDVASCLSKLHPQTRALFTEAEKLIQLCLCLPISVASSERSFSNLRRLKTWLRSTMTEETHTLVPDECPQRHFECFGHPFPHERLHLLSS